MNLDLNEDTRPLIIQAPALLHLPARTIETCCILIEMRTNIQAAVDILRTVAQDLHDLANEAINNKA